MRALRAARAARGLTGGRVSWSPAANSDNLAGLRAPRMLKIRQRQVDAGRMHEASVAFAGDSYNVPRGNRGGE